MENLLQNRLAEVESRLEAACRRAGRKRSEVTLVAVTKTVSVEVAARLPELGVHHLGESRPQELWRKASALPMVHWHQIGHLQRNKIDKTLPLVHLIHSVDSLRLLQALEEEAGRQQRPVDVLLEVNAGREEQKHGFTPDDIDGLIPRIEGLQKVRIHGLMTMAALAADPERCRPTFAALRQLRDRLAGLMPPPHSLACLSMGMSNDFDVAVEEGATHVRLGTILFAGLGKS